MGDLGGETSMEDILSSIKRIIAEESDGGPSVARARKPQRPATEAAPSAEADSERDDAVLELNEVHAPPPPVARTSPGRAAPADVPATATERKGKASDAAPAAAAPAANSPAAPAPDPATILSDQAARATSRSLEALSRVIVAPQSPVGETLEDLVREMLRPMLRDWLDANLPAMVETMVAREIARITARNA